MALIDRVKCDALADSVIVWKYPSEELSTGTQLIVNQSQEALFVKNGVPMDLFGPGTYTLDSSNIPILSVFINLPFGGKTPFTAEVWYVNKTVKRDLKWGTVSPMQIIDPKFNIPVSVRAYGTWGYRVTDSRSFLAQVIGSQQGDANYGITSKRIYDYFIGELLQKFSATLAKYLIAQQISLFDINLHLNQIVEQVYSSVFEEFNRYGVEITNFNIQSISIPEEEAQKIQNIMVQKLEIEQISQAQVGQAYVTMRTFNALDKAAQNESGPAGGLIAGGLGVGIGMGAAMPLAQQLGKQMNTQMQDDNSATNNHQILDKIKTLKTLLESDLITKEEYEEKKNKLIAML